MNVVSERLSEMGVTENAPKLPEALRLTLPVSLSE